MSEHSQSVYKRIVTATRQYRHNTDNSPDLFNPAEGFVTAYDKDETERIVSDMERELTDLRERLETAETKYREQVQETYRQWTMNMEKNDRIRKLESLLRRHVDLQVGSLSKEEEDQLRQETFDALAAAPAGESESGRNDYEERRRIRAMGPTACAEDAQQPAHQSADEAQPDSGEDDALVALDRCANRGFMKPQDEDAIRRALRQRTRVPEEIRDIPKAMRFDANHFASNVKERDALHRWANKIERAISRRDEQEGA